MDGHVADRIDLEIAGDHPVLGAVHVDVVKACQELAGVDSLAQFRMIERNVERGLVVPIDHAGHPARAAYGPGGPLAGPRTCRRLDFLDGRHFVFLILPRQRASAPTAFVAFCVPPPYPPLQTGEGRVGEIPPTLHQRARGWDLVPRLTSRG